MSVCESSEYHQIPDALWERVEPMLSNYKISCKGCVRGWTCGEL